MVVGTLTTTLGDYFGDLSVWSDEYLWPRCVRACLEGLLSAYLEQLAAREGAPLGLDFDQGSESTTTSNGSARSSSSISSIGSGLRSSVSSGGVGLKRAASAAKMASSKWRGKATTSAATAEANAATSDSRDNNGSVNAGQHSSETTTSSGANSGASEGGDEQPAINSQPSSSSSSSSHLRSVSETSALSLPPPFRDVSSAAARLEADAAALQSFFGAFDDELEAAGLRVDDALSLAAPSSSSSSSSSSSTSTAATPPSSPSAQAWAPLQYLAAILRASDPSAASGDVINCVAALRVANLHACPVDPPLRFQRCATNLLTMVWARRPPGNKAASSAGDASGGSELALVEMAEFEEIVAAVFV